MLVRHSTALSSSGQDTTWWKHASTKALSLFTGASILSSALVPFAASADARIVGQIQGRYVGLSKQLDGRGSPVFDDPATIDPCAVHLTPIFIANQSVALSSRMPCRLNPSTTPRSRASRSTSATFNDLSPNVSAKASYKILPTLRWLVSRRVPSRLPTTLCPAAKKSSKRVAACSSRRYASNAFTTSRKIRPFTCPTLRASTRTTTTTRRALRVRCAPSIWTEYCARNCS